MDIAVTLSLLATVVAICGTIYGIFSNKKKNDDSDKHTNISQGREAGTILTELGYIKAQIDEVKTKQDKMDERYIRFTEEIAKLNAFKSEANNKFVNIDRKIDDINKLIRHFHEEKPE